MGVAEASTIIGSNANNKRRKMDFYPTPKEVTISLLDFLQIPKTLKIWEPACGQNHMVNVMRDRGYEVVGTDIQDGVDFLTAELPEGVDWIITNPPFSVSQDFIERCIELHKPFALLLKSQYWHASKRSRLFMRYPPSYVLPLTWRPDFTGQGSSLMDVMWCVWDYKGLPYALYKPLLKPKNMG
jgi:hypothetical protein